MLDKVQREWMASMAYLYIQQRRYKQAIVLLEALDVLKSEDPYTLKALALAYLNEGRHEEALRCVDVIIEKGLLDEDCQDDDSDGMAPLLLIKSHALWKLGHTALSRETMQKYLAAHQKEDSESINDSEEQSNLINSKEAA